ncbi:phosphoribosylamine--glycine ligase [Rhodothermus marinus]|uniref:phosphoribosylamine--glycine ligase n=1 Tax=Rhodothermus marinus TaxID=29549 RepID=UPI000223DCBE|nr:phosphoribosylamine--glycine ligase [Rhodothermus marinus]AEN73180.1 Phosphoribosylamine--glycine ligase [Rhodothermus marinus SG0.5JP17-172]MBO2491911.1 phosphoribosylamine--glycine ligase [Rhodothermus marinus]BBM69854.1 phosphoribosylamine--glycine ligase [Rhodothermus marinus]BBM72840.1 phosphoribosylamine--glycine ligase [Rhodothermus marinus]
MRILVLGSGGREHAITWALAQSPQRPDLFIAPGNPGTAALGRNVPIAANDAANLRKLVRDEGIELVVVGPEQPLVEGVADALRAEGARVVGPSAAAARLEGSKAFAKAFMQRHGIPTAAYRTFAAEQLDEALAYIDRHPEPLVVKASGLAAGKGAVVCATREEARRTLRWMMEEGGLGKAGHEVVIEEFMEGEEASVFALTDGRDYVLLAPAQDHKRIGEGDTGPNTGGMGAYAPAPVVTEAVLERVAREIVEPVLAGMADEGHPYQGVLYCGLMITDEGPKVVEFNCRLGDPEAQVVLPVAEVDWVEVFDRVASGQVAGFSVPPARRAAACVVLASEGYPGSYRKGLPIEGLEAAEALPDVIVFQAGTRRADDGRLVTAGGRVLGVTAVAESLAAAIRRAYEGVEVIQFEGKYFRRDIGQKGLARLATAGSV